MPILDITPTSIHQREEIILGSREDVDECLAYYAGTKS